MPLTAKEQKKDCVVKLDLWKSDYEKTKSFKELVGTILEQITIDREVNVVAAKKAFIRLSDK